MLKILRLNDSVSMVICCNFIPKSPGMKMFPKIALFSVFLLLLGLSACIKEQQYPIEPVISFQQYGVVRDVSNYDSLGRLTISYTDGDGDIGLYDSDTVEPYKYNFYLKFLQMKNGQLTELLPVDSSLNFNARIPILTPTGRNKNIKGEISIDLQLTYARLMLQSDTIAFDVFIRDRALHQSNVVRTPLFLIAKP